MPNNDFCCAKDDFIEHRTGINDTTNIKLNIENHRKRSSVSNVTRKNAQTQTEK